MNASFDLVVQDLGGWRVRNGRAEPLNGQNDPVDFKVATDSEGLAALVSGRSPLGLLLSGRIRVRGSRRQALNVVGAWLQRNHSELRREERQRVVQVSRDWTASDHGKLYVEAEQAAWSADSIDLADDKRDWRLTSAAVQQQLIARIGALAGADAPLRHLAFIDRYAAEVLVLDAEDPHGRLRELRERADPMADAHQLEFCGSFPGLREGLRLMKEDQRRRTAFLDARPRG